MASKNKKKQVKKTVTPATNRNTGETSGAKKNLVSSKPVIEGSWKINAGIFLLLALATVFLYSKDLHIGFFDTDDTGYVTENPFIKSFSAENLQRIFAKPYFANYSPLHLLSYMIDYAIGGLDAYSFHLSSNIWAGLVSGLVFLVALALTNNRIISIASAILFIVHPVHVEAIAWISSRKDLVAATFILPSFLVYLKYRKAITKKTTWYCLSLFLFILALAGKLSVATFPAVLLAYDLFIERRSLARSIVDKVPFLIAGAIFAMAVSAAQPPTGHHLDPLVLSGVFFQNLWILSGFGTYVIYRVPPEAWNAILKLFCLLGMLAAFILPYFLRRRYPLMVMLIYWILFTFIPSQVLSFIHPVADRYMYLPSVGVVIMITVGIFEAGKWLGEKGKLASIIALLVIAFFWTKATIGYINEWADPRSVWYTAVRKSSDPQVFSGLGIHYQNVSDKLGPSPRGTPLTKEEALRLAATIWADNPKLPALKAEIQAGKQDGETIQAFKNYMHQLAWDAFDTALKNKITTMTNVYFRRGLILFDDGKFEEAKKEFLATINEASHDTYEEGRDEFVVRSHNALGIVAWHEGNYQEAYRYLKMASNEQNQFGKLWVPELEGNLKQLEGILSSQPH
jgi:hypothetical protein